MFGHMRLFDLPEYATSMSCRSPESSISSPALFFQASAYVECSTTYAAPVSNVSTSVHENMTATSPDIVVLLPLKPVGMANVGAGSAGILTERVAYDLPSEPMKTDAAEPFAFFE